MEHLHDPLLITLSQADFQGVSKLKFFQVPLSIPMTCINAPDENRRYLLVEPRHDRKLILHMTLSAFSFAVFALLLSPGPTNTLMGLAGARNGLRCASRLIPAEMLGYLTTVLPLAWLGSEAVEHLPGLAIVLQLAAAVWVMFVAVSLWRVPANVRMPSEVTAIRVYLTTVLNPKALIFGLVLLPSLGDSEFTPKLGIFGVMVMAVALIWGSAGSLTTSGNSGSRRLPVVQRIASGWLAVVSITLILGVIRSQLE